ncbi:MAG: hypothetical protein M1812_006059 [Candelaria pacifica]|nr:MAG: hypothetical protein M1812_006059 [Candelaria pacifica]
MASRGEASSNARVQGLLSLTQRLLGRVFELEVSSNAQSKRIAELEAELAASKAGPDGPLTEQSALAAAPTAPTAPPAPALLPSKSPAAAFEEFYLGVKNNLVFTEQRVEEANKTTYQTEYWKDDLVRDLVCELGNKFRISDDLEDHMMSLKILGPQQCHGPCTEELNFYVAWCRQPKTSYWTLPKDFK